MIKSKFSIKDLENLSGIKAHTIRIWEKRYQILAPERTESNIRSYDTHSLQKILNVSYLNNHGIKISAIAELDEAKIEVEVHKIAQETNSSNHSVQEIKLAMINFDKQLFDQVYSNGFEKLGFKGVFRDILIPFLQELGHLWHSNTVNVAHEHFISHLIKQKLLSHTESVEYQTDDRHQEVYILFLPPNEMHDLGLLFLNYELLSRGRKTIYLGASMNLESLTHFKQKKVKPIFVTYITVYPSIKKIPNFLNQFEKKVGSNDENELWILGPAVPNIKHLELNEGHKTFDSIPDFVHNLEALSI